MQKQIQGKLGIVRSLGQGNFVCYIRYFVISVVNKHLNNTKQSKLFHWDRRKPLVIQGNPVITRSSGPPTLPCYNRYLVINKLMIKYIKCNAWDYTLISYITTYYNHIHATVIIHFLTINRRK